MSRLLVLLATIPARRASCERLLAELARQSRPPDGVILCLDGYAPDLAGAPTIPAALASVPTFAFRVLQRAPSGPGCRWRLAEDLLDGLAAVRGVSCLGVAGGAAPAPPADLAPEDILVCLDDDLALEAAPRFLEALAVILETTNAAAAAMGHTPGGLRAPPGEVSRGRLLLACGCGLALRAGHLRGLQAFAAELCAKGARDPLGPGGDDQALVSCHLWRRGVPILHAAAGAFTFAAGTQRTSETSARQARGEVTLHEQAQEIAHLTGWPLAAPIVEVAAQPVLTWEAELAAVPAGARPAQGAAPPPGHRRVLVVDAGEPEASGVYDVPSEGPGA